MATRQFKLKEGELIQFSSLPARIADALHDNEDARKAARRKIGAELSQMAGDGELIVRDALTLEPLSFDRDDVPGYGVLTADDLRPLLLSKGLSLDIRELIRISARHKRISVEDAITLVIDAIDSVNDVREDGFTEVEWQASCIESDFAEVCTRIDIVPRLPYYPLDEYTGEHSKANEFEITVEEFRRYAAEYGVAVEFDDRFTPAQTGDDAKDTTNGDKGKPATLTHRLPSRSHFLNAEIQEARKRAASPDDTSSVWAELLKMADDNHGLLIGQSSDGLQYKGKNYQETGVPDTLTLKALRDRLRRAKKREHAVRHDSTRIYKT